MRPREVLERRIESEGPLPFDEFVEEALYGEEGYYETGGGPGEDFRTSSEVHPGFAYAFLRLFERAGVERVVEVGAGEGHFAEALIEAADREGLDLRYVAVERSGSAREALEERVSGAEVYGSLGEVEVFEGAVFSNELFDALPFRVVEMGDEGLEEVLVGLDEGGFVERRREAPGELRDYFDWLEVELEEGYRAEVNLEALDVLERMDRVLGEGLVVTVDYGYRSEDLYSMRRRDGTVTCYEGERMSEDPLEGVGERDVTHKVNFSALIRRGEEFGWGSQGPVEQGLLLNELGLQELIGERREELGRREFQEWFVPLRKLLMPDGMGGSHKVLVQTKDVEVEVPSRDELLEKPG